MTTTRRPSLVRAAVVFVLAGACILGCGPRAHSQITFISNPHPWFDYPRVDGSTSTHPLDMALACEMNGIPWAWVSPGMDWKGLEKGPELRVTPIISNPGDTAQRALADQIKSRINHNGTNPSYVSLINRQSDLILVARAPSEDELKLAREKGVELETTAVARDALVFVVNQLNPVENLSLDQLRGIYSGKIKSWTQVGWAEKPAPDSGANPEATVAALPPSVFRRRNENFKDMDIVPYTRNRNSGSQELLDALVMRGLPRIEAITESDPMTMIMEMYPVIDTIAEDGYGLCYTVYYYEEFMYKSAFVKTLAVDGVAPVAETIATGKYPLTADVYAVIRNDEAPASPARKLLEWILSDDGQKAVAKSGYVRIRN